MEVMCNNFMPGDSRLVEQLVSELKSQGIFDQFRKECISDVDTKPAYQNLRQRVEGSVSTFLKGQTWSVELNKNQLREQLRKNLQESGFLETGVERIVDQVVNPKINSVFLPKVEEVVYKFLGLENPNKNMKREPEVPAPDPLPTDLEAVSPGSVQSDQVDLKKADSDVFMNAVEAGGKMEDDDPPPFEPHPVDSKENGSEKMNIDENTRDSHLSGFSGLESHESNLGSDNRVFHMEISNQDSQISHNSSESHLSIITSEETSKMDISEDSNTILKPEKAEVLVEDEENVSPEYEPIDKETIKLEKIDNKIDIVSQDDKNQDDEKTEKKPEKTEERRSKTNEKSSKDKKDDRKEDKKDDKKDNKKDDKHRKSSSSSSREKDKSSSKSHSSSKDKDRKDSRSSSSHKDKDKNKDKADKEKIDKDKDKSSKYREKSEKDKSKPDKERSDKDKSRSDKSKIEKENANKAEKEKSGKEKSDRSKDEKSKSKTDKYKSEKDRHKSDKDKSSSKDKDRSDKDKSSKDKDKYKDKSYKSKEKSDKEKEKSSTKEKSSSDRSSSKKDAKEKKDDNKESSKESKDKTKEENKEKDKSRSSSSSSKHTSSKDKKPSTPKKESSSSSHKKSSPSDPKSKSSSEKGKKDEGTNSNKKDKQESKAKSKDDHYSFKIKKSDRRSTDRDSNDGTSSKNVFNSYSESTTSRSGNNSQDYSSSSFTSGSGDSGNSDKTETVQKESNGPVEAPAPAKILLEMPRVKYIKPKFAMNFEEARKIMKIRKQLAMLERQNQLSLARLIPVQNSIVNGETNKDDNTSQTAASVNKEQTKTVDISEEKENINTSRAVDDTIIQAPVDNKSVNKVETVCVDASINLITEIESRDISKENWEALEAKLAQVMSEVDYNCYDSDEDFEFHGYSSIDIIPKNFFDVNRDLVKKTEEEISKNQKASKLLEASVQQSKLHNLKINSEEEQVPNIVNSSRNSNKNVQDSSPKKTEEEISKDQNASNLLEASVQQKSQLHNLDKINSEEEHVHNIVNSSPNSNKNVQNSPPKKTEEEICKHQHASNLLEVSVQQSERHNLNKINSEEEQVPNIVSSSTNSNKNVQDSPPKKTEEEISKDQNASNLLEASVQQTELNNIDKINSEKEQVPNIVNSNTNSNKNVQDSPPSSSEKTYTREILNANVKNTELLAALSDDKCYFLKEPSCDEESYLSGLKMLISRMEVDIEQCTENLRNNVWPSKRGRKRKLEVHVDIKNNNKTPYMETDITPTEHFSLPLSPAESDKSNERKDEDLVIPIKQKRIMREYTQRYSSEDLYKPRPVFGRRRKQS
ncbi:biorientation of chromosomes in cell division protein 1-like 1 isoform X2 [Diabrotica virgifera virgifera]|uniref:Biorientation of chromosomes in cell division protein 1-like 1 isoform X2 n=1 Tax=Diabrotica virgifera virgifera TaxID=50390 RepID=A0A6P7HAH7_DIAVI|nr:biorientation of chromosomes in cell division protein 1-like 1 isoform X2 [Diabrotica virgifera virgifera]